MKKAQPKSHEKKPLKLPRKAIKLKAPRRAIRSALPKTTEYRNLLVAAGLHAQALTRTHEQVELLPNPEDHEVVATRVIDTSKKGLATLGKELFSQQFAGPTDNASEYFDDSSDSDTNIDRTIMHV